MNHKTIPPLAWLREDLQTRAENNVSFLLRPLALRAKMPHAVNYALGEHISPNTVIL